EISPEESVLGADDIQDNLLTVSNRGEKSLNIEEYPDKITRENTNVEKNEIIKDDFNKYLESLIEVTPEGASGGITQDATVDSPSSPLDKYLFGSISKAELVKEKLYEKFSNMIQGNIRDTVVPHMPETFNEFTWDSLVIYLIERIIKDISPEDLQELTNAAGDVENEDDFFNYIESLIEYLNSKIAEKAKSKYPEAEEMSLQQLLEAMDSKDAKETIKYLKTRLFQEFQDVWGIQLPFVGKIEKIWQKLEENEYEFNVREYIPFDEPMAGGMGPLHSISDIIGNEFL
ncbi:unnamed protein product, partial [Meganyctiphanes norvegica]